MPSNLIKMQCARCLTEETFYRPEINHSLHITLSLLTGGLWLVSYAAIAIGHRFQPWVCSACEHSQVATRQAPTMVFKY